MPYTTNTFDSDTKMTIHSVPGRLKRRTVGPRTALGCFEHQDWISESRPVKGWGPSRVMRVELRFDDNCHNGHNTFGITAHIYHPGCRSGNWDACGCMHDEITEYFPELAHLIQWHGTTTEGPLHYIANTLYLAGDRDCHGKRKGDVLSSQPAVVFESVPVRHLIDTKFAAFLRARIGTGEFQVVAVPHKDTSSYAFDPYYTLVGHDVAWHSCPFKTRAEADDFCAALNTCTATVVDVPTSYSKGKERELDAARRVANWSEATDEQLALPPEQLRELLEARLPGLLDGFRDAMEGCGFYWSPEAIPATVSEE